VKNVVRILALMVVVSFFLQCNKEEAPDLSLPVYALDTVSIPFVIPRRFPELPLANRFRLNRAKLELGNRLFQEPRMSKNGSSCSSCHLKEKAFSLPGVNSESFVNLAWNSNFLRNGKFRAVSLQRIMEFEVEEFFGTDPRVFDDDTTYRRLFLKAFGNEFPDNKMLAEALSHFFKSLVSSRSRFDLYQNNLATLSNQEQRGMVIFFSEIGDCYHCHRAPLFTDNQFHNIGLEGQFSNLNAGLFQITADSNDLGLYKTPSLRNIELTAPYMHDGRFSSLEEVVRHYNQGVKYSPTLDPIMTKRDVDLSLNLTNQEVIDLVAFLKTLTDTGYVR
jgi:cytochrome c peroxidase